MKEIDKTCSCGMHYTELPIDTRAVAGLYWFTCSCGSTLTEPTDDLSWRRTAKDAREANNRVVIGRYSLTETKNIRSKHFKDGKKLKLVSEDVD